MLPDHLRIAWRTINRHKTFTFFNVAGLSIGVTAFVLLSLYITYELSYDKFHKHTADIYRVRHDTYRGNEFEGSSAITYHGAAPAILANFPEVENYVRLHRADGMINYYKDDGHLISHHEFNAFYADTSFFSIFTFALKSGDARKALRTPNTVLISETAARKYFGDENPIGRTLKLTTQWQGGEYIIEGIFFDAPENTHLKFDFLFPIDPLLNNAQFKNGDWYWANFYSYLLLNKGTDPVAFEKKLSVVIDEHLGVELKKSGLAEKFALQPLTSIHLYSNIGAEITANGNYMAIWFLMVLAGFIIVIVWLNYVNLSLARYTQRMREVGVRKIIGSQVQSIFWQFTIESLLVQSLALVVVTILIITLLPAFENLTLVKLMLDPSQQPGLLVVSAIVLSGTIFCACYPAAMICNLRPLNSLKGTFSASRSSILSRRLLTGVQLGATSVAIIATVLVYRQLDFMLSQPLGIQVERKLIVRAPKIIVKESYLNAVAFFKNDLKRNPEITTISSSSEVPGREIFWTGELRTIQETEGTRHFMNILVVDEDFLPVYGLNILAGRNFSKDGHADYGDAVIVNETAMKQFGFAKAEDALNENIVLNGWAVKKIIGVVADYHQQSLKSAIRPIVMQFVPWTSDFITINFNGNQTSEFLELTEMSYHKAFPDNAFEYFFLDSQYDQQYRGERRLLNLFKVFAGISIFCACMGLFGLSAFVVNRRKKEIAIRKVNGASVWRIIQLLTTEYLWLIFAAMIVSIPATGYLVNEWMESFPYRPDTSWLYFVAGGAITLAIGLFAISANVLRAAIANPIASIKSE